VELVPGDVFEPYGEIPCDAMVLSGDIYVNEANLTGESYPIGKFPVTTIESTDENNTWLFEGSKVLESRSHSLAVVINIGFQTCRGRIIRKILTRERR
jgi:cation-transporting ATPase 13A2